ncbi:RNA 2'-phosphotransferase [Candidatus Electronema sp. PJ]|uniref:RNA 2'-phosphotransferase n=1 Tax=Candidatus Electronema sp. PJ TaxID=3401572 RepID=UPI003AA7FF35
MEFQEIQAMYVSKFLSLVLRHKPELIGLRLDAEGWADINALIANAAEKNIVLSHEVICSVVQTNDKQRFSLTADCAFIRANQGHSIPVALNLPEHVPPPCLFHGTASRFLSSIREKGLLPGARQHVHLSADAATALRVGARHGKPVVLQIDAARMYQAGCKFFLSENNVWLVDAVPSSYIVFDAALPFPKSSSRPEQGAG